MNSFPKKSLIIFVVAISLLLIVHILVQLDRSYGLPQIPFPGNDVYRPIDWNNAHVTNGPFKPAIQFYRVNDNQIWGKLLIMVLSFASVVSCITFIILWIKYFTVSRNQNLNKLKLTKQKWN